MSIARHAPQRLGLGRLGPLWYHAPGTVGGSAVARPVHIVVLTQSSDDAAAVQTALESGGFAPHIDYVCTEEALAASLASSPDALITEAAAPVRPVHAIALASRQGIDLPLIVLNREPLPDLRPDNGQVRLVVFAGFEKLAASLQRLLDARALPAERDEAERAVRRREAILSAVGAVAERVLQGPRRESTLRAGLAELGRAADVSRIYVFENVLNSDGEMVARQRYEWAADGVAPQITNPDLQNLRHDGAVLAPLVERLARGEAVYGNTPDFPQGTQEELQREGITSIVLVPIFIGQAWWGFIGFDECRAQRTWGPAEIDALRAAAGLLGAAVQRKMAEDARASADDMFRNLVEDSLVGIAIIGGDMRFHYVNRRMAEIFGYTRSEMLSLLTEDVVDPRDASLVRSNIAARLDGIAQSVRYAFRALHKSGALLELEVLGTRITHEGEPAVLGTCLDVTDRNRLERELLEISDRQMLSLGQDVHDGLGQHLTGIGFLSKVLAQSLEAKQLPEADDAKQVASLVMEAMRETRALARGLHPVEDQPTGLMTALQEFAAQVRSLYNVECTVECRRPVEIADSVMATHLYRIAQEAVTNAVKHGAPNSVLIALSAVTGWILLIVKDDGRGIPNDFDPHKGMGLNIMRYRARVIGATVEVENDPDGGVLVTVTVPHPAAGKRE